MAVYKLRLLQKVLLTIAGDGKEKQPSTFIQSESLYWLSIYAKHDTDFSSENTGFDGSQVLLTNFYPDVRRSNFTDLHFETASRCTNL